MDYPYQDTESELLPGEEWKDIPGFEGYYKASNLGRIKSLDRTIPHPRLKVQFVKGRILSQSISSNKNTIADQPMIDLRVTLNKEGQSYYFNTRRLVYSAFIKALDYDQDQLYVINKDCNGYNNTLDNLEAVERKVKSDRAFSRKRVPESYLSYADRSQWKGKVYGGLARRKPIKQLKNGQLVQRYESVAEASRSTGFGEKEIIEVAKGRREQYHCFVWEYDKQKDDK